MANAQISDGTSTGTGGSPPATGTWDIQFGDYSGMTYFQGKMHPIWADNSNSTGDNPDPTKFDAYTDTVGGGAAANEGDPHITTIDGVSYDFQSAGEFFALRGDGLVIQTRQTAIATTFDPGPNPYTGLATCVSVNTAVAARVGAHRVTYQPNISGVPDPSGLQLRVDGVLMILGTQGLKLGGGGRVVKAAVGDGIEIDFPNGATLVATPGWWASQNVWYLNVDVFHSPAGPEAIMGAIARGSWLPALPDGTSLGPMPASLDQRYTDLYRRFANAWRVSNETSLFDYALGTSTATFTVPSWPPRSGSGACLVPPPNPDPHIPPSPPAQPLDPATAQMICQPIGMENMRANCVFDVMVTGEPRFAETYLLSQKLLLGATTTTVSDNKDPTHFGEPVTFTATVARMSPKGAAPAGTVQFILDGTKVATPVKLDSNGQATLETSSLAGGNHQVAASYIPGENTVFLASSSLDEPHTVKAVTEACDVNNDNKIDRNDIAAILELKNTHAAPGFPSDASGMVTVEVARGCVLKCTKAGCAP